MSRITDVDTYVEKVAASAAHRQREKTAAGIGWNAISGIARGLGGAFKKPKAFVPAAIGLGGLGVVAGTGVLGGVLGADRQDQTMSYRINRGLNSLFDRIRADEVAGEAFASSLGKSTADSLMGLTQDVVTKGYETLKDTLHTSPVRREIFKSLKREDPLIADAPNKVLLEAFHTMSKIAPQLSTDKNAVKSVLREAAMSGGGLDFATIKGLADAEKSVMQAKNPGARK